MRLLRQPWTGLALALAILGLDAVFGGQGWVSHLSLAFVYPYSRRAPRSAWAYAAAFVAGLGALKWGSGYFEDLAAWPEMLAVLGLVYLPQAFERRVEKQVNWLEDQRRKLLAERETLERQLQEQKPETGAAAQHLRSVEHLFDVMRVVGSTLDVEGMLNLAQGNAEKMFLFRHFVLAMESADGQKYEIRAVSGCDDRTLRFFSVDRKAPVLAARLAEISTPLWVPDTSQDPRWSKLEEASVRSFVFVPFPVRDTVIGFLCAYSRQGSLLDQERFKNLQVFCTQIAIGLQKALLYEKVQRLSITDGLTRLFSYRHFRKRLEEELKLAKRYSSVLSLLIFDIDHFKRYNDTYGHLAGDQVLQEVARLLREGAEASNLVARYGGEEMLLLAPETDQARAAEMAENIRKSVERHVFVVGKDSTRVTVSVGVAVFPRDAGTGLELVAKSDKAMYAAKEGGRNRVVVYEPHLETVEKSIDTPGAEG